MAQIVTITNPLTGQPAQVDQLDHTAQEIDDGIGFESTDYPGCYYRMVDGVVEWFNPPMLIGVEYRTTERYFGKPVYTMAFSTGNLRAAGVKAVITKSTDQNGNALSPHYLVSCFGVINQEASVADGRYVIPTMAYGGSVGDDGIVRVMTACSSTIGIQIIVYAPARDLSSKSAVFTAKYTKTKDD